jgi:cobalt-zinc-cadmium efflux system protein
LGFRAYLGYSINNMKRSHSHQHKRREVKSENLLIAAILNFTITLVEIAGGLFSNSIALLSDSLHNFGDSIAIFLAYVSTKISKKSPTNVKTFGFKRLEIMAAMFNGLLMVFICIYLIYEAFERLANPSAINGAIMVVIASIGLLANFFAMSILKEDKEKNLNVKAAYVHLLSDTLSSVAVLLGGILIYYYKVFWIDPILTILISVYVLREAWIILKQAYLILLQATPDELDLAKVKATLESLLEIENVHHIHAWKLNDKEIHFECHVDLRTNLKISETESILFQMKQLLRDIYNIAHTTVQFEYNTCNDKSMIKRN